MTGMSGAGKSTVLKILEDIGYFCADNIPIPLLEKFTELANTSETEYNKVALGVDIRSGREIESLQGVLERLTVNGLAYEILYLDANDAALVRRYKETRRSHPLARDGRVEDGITEERGKMSFLKNLMILQKGILHARNMNLLYSVFYIKTWKKHQRRE